MQRLFLMLLIMIFGISGVMGCAGLRPTDDTGKPKITLERVDLMRMAPWVELPAPTLMAMGFVFNVDNPSSYPIKLENCKFSVLFEAPGKNEFMTISTATVYDQIYFAPKSVSQYRVVEFIDSGGVMRALLIPNRPAVVRLGLEVNPLTKEWFTKIATGEFPFKIKAGEGMAVFSSEGAKGDFFVPFEGIFPKK
ncbi:MAG: hypothetical protein FJ130_12995 [Deltaproteobacteria bacterium]|nr:hypothetical protein [Deltaproteobacteria bacterium]